MSEQEEEIKETNTDEPSTPAKDEDKAEMTREELMNNWKRAVADFENYKKRKEAEGSELLQFAKEMTVSKLTPSLQNLEQVLKFAPNDEKYKDWLMGLKGTITQLEKDMEELGLKKIKTVGEQFDPTKHEAVEEVEGESGKIISEVQPGFILNSKVIIPAKVTVGKKIEPSS